MGLGISSIQNLLELKQLGYLDGCKSVFEMGSQELHLKSKDFEELIRMAGIENYKSKDFPNLNNWPNSPRCSSRFLFQMLGIDKYACFDLNEEHGAIPHDFNLPFEDKSFFSKFDLVTDYGSCEHAFNVGETYRTMHKLCKLGGLIIIAQSLWGGNGYFLYDRSFIEGMAAANNYRILYSSYSVNPKSKSPHGSDSQYHVPMSKALLGTINLNKTIGIGAYVVLKKQADTDFKFPYQGQHSMTHEGHIGFNRLFHKDPPGYSYIPVYDSELSSVPSRVLLQQLASRIKRQISK